MIGGGNVWVPATEVFRDVPFTEAKSNGRDQMRVDVDRLIVQVEPARQRCAGLVRHRPVAVLDVLILLVPFWDLIV